MSIDLYDHDLLAIDKGPVAWMTRHQGSSMGLEHFRRAAEEQFAEVGFRATVKCYETNEAGTYAFDIEINGRIEKHDFDFDRQVHEVTSGVLLGEASGTIKTSDAMKNVDLKGHKCGG